MHFWERRFILGSMAFSGLASFGSLCRPAGTSRLFVINYSAWEWALCSGGCFVPNWETEESLFTGFKRHFCLCGGEVVKHRLPIH